MSCWASSTTSKTSNMFGDKYYFMKLIMITVWKGFLQPGKNCRLFDFRWLLIIDQSFNFSTKCNYFEKKVFPTWLWKNLCFFSFFFKNKNWFLKRLPFGYHYSLPFYFISIPASIRSMYLSTSLPGLFSMLWERPGNEVDVFV